MYQGGVKMLKVNENKLTWLAGLISTDGHISKTTGGD